jgi:hypothetical protein
MPSIREQLERFEAARARLRASVDTLDKELAGIERRWRAGELDERGVREHSRRARRTAAWEIDAALRDARTALTRGVELTQEMRVRRRGTKRAREHVRRLVDSGEVEPGAVLERAIELDDPETIAALRGELMWYGKSAKGDVIPEVADLLTSCDRALGRLSTGEEASEAKAAVELLERAPAFDQLAEFAAKFSTEPAAPARPDRVLRGGATPKDRIMLGYAENAGRVADEP